MNHIREGKTARERAVALLEKMTLTEKVGQLNQKLYGFQIYERTDDGVIFHDEFKEEVQKYGGLGIVYGLYRADPWSNRDYHNGLYGTWAVKAYNQMQAYVLGHSRLKIPVMLSSECPHGHQALDSYLLPVNLAMGATFHPELIYDAYTVCGNQLKDMGVDLALISLLDVARDPRWGRTEECFSEDSWLCSQMARQVVTAVQEQGVAVVAKHFAAQGEGTGGINASPARIGERELREIHLPAMKACCDAKVKGVMAAYNEIDGIYCHANKHLLTDILREEMGFRGIVMADGCALDRLDTMTGDNTRSGAVALKAGVDVGLWDTAYGKLEDAVQKGYITEQEVDQAVLRVLEMKFERGLFEHPFLTEESQPKIYSIQQYPQALSIARESVVLLENKNKILPLSSPMGQIAVIGSHANDIYHQLGDYTPPVKEEDSITILKGIKDCAKSMNCKVVYAKGCDTTTGSTEEIKEAVKIAKESDVTVLVLGGSSSRFGKASFDTNGAVISDSGVSMDCGEGVDASNIELPSIQRELADAIFEVGNKVIVVIMGGRSYALGTIPEKADALLYAFYPGLQGGQAIAEILFGKVNPSGRMPISVPRSSGQLPAYYNYKNSYQGLHYYDQPEGSAYSFGDGMGSSEFLYENISVNANNMTLEKLRESGITIKMTIKNMSHRGGYAVPLLYIAGLQGSVVRRVKELKNMQKVWIECGQAKTITMDLPYEVFSVWNQEMQYVTEAGKVKLILEEMGKTMWSEIIELRP